MKTPILAAALLAVFWASTSVGFGQFTVLTATGDIHDHADAEALLASSPVDGGEWSTISFGFGTPQNNPFPNNLDGTDKFGLSATGVLAVNASGSYVFAVDSDDSFRLRLDDSVAAENLGCCALVPSAPLTLPAGSSHRLELTFAELNGAEHLALFYAKDGGSFALLGTGANFTVSPVPEPQCYGLVFALGLLGCLFLKFQRRVRMGKT